MTAPATTRRAGPFLGNGVTTSFPFTFKVFATSDIAVTRTAAGADTALTLGVDYNVTLNGDQDTSPGGSITYPISGTPLAVGQSLVAIGALPYDQTADLPSGGNYRAIVIENALDRTVMQVQQLVEEVGRSLTLPASAAGTDTDLPAPEANKVIAWNSTATGLVNLGTDDLGAVVVAGATYTTRAAPSSNFNFFTDDFTVTGCTGPGGASVQQDLYDVWMTKYSSLMTGGGTAATWVATTGNDGTGTGTYSAPYLTIDKAIRTTASGLVYVAPGTYDSTGFRYTDTQGDRPKMIVAPFGGVTIRVDGDALSGETFTDRSGSGQPNTYEATLGTANHVIRVLLSTQVDKLGLPMPMPKQSSIATVDSSGYGWWYDSAAQKIYIRNGTDNVNTNKANYSAVYATGGDNSLLVQSAKLYLENITLLRYPWSLKVSGQAVPEVWLKNCTVRYAEGTSRLVSGGGCYSQGCTYYRSAADHANYTTATGTTAYGVEINDTTYFPGDVATFGSGATQPNNPISTGQDKNCSSNHSGYVVRINGVHEGSYGPVIADTDGSYTWNLGVQAGYSYATGASRYGWIVQGSAARAWLDGCSAGPGNSGLNSDNNAVTRTFFTFGAQVVTNSGTFMAYLPG